MAKIAPASEQPSAEHPFGAARRSRAAERGDIKTVRQTFLDRLTMLGATTEEIEAADEAWDQLDEEWTEEYRTMAALDWSDDELLIELAAIRGDFTAQDQNAEGMAGSTQGAPDPAAGTSTADPGTAGAGSTLVTLPDGLLDSSVPVIVAQVADDRGLAQAVLAAETNRPDGKEARKGLVDAMEKVVAAGA